MTLVIIALLLASWPSKTSVPETSKSALLAELKSIVALLLPSASTVKVPETVASSNVNSSPGLTVSEPLTVKVPSTSISLDPAVLAELLTVRLKNSLLAPVVMVLLAPLNTTVPSVVDWKVPPLQSQFPAILWIPPCAVKVPEEAIEKSPSKSKVLSSDAFMSKVPPVIVKSPLISKAFSAVLVPAPTAKLKKLFPEWFVMVLLSPLKVTVPAEGVNPPLVPLSSQLPATSWLPDPAVKVPDVIVKSPSKSSV